MSTVIVTLAHVARLFAQSGSNATFTEMNHIPHVTHTRCIFRRDRSDPIRAKCKQSRDIDKDRSIESEKPDRSFLKSYHILPSNIVVNNKYLDNAAQN